MDNFVAYMATPQTQAAAPQKLNEASLHRIVDEFPWFTAARLLRAHLTGKEDPQLSLQRLLRPASSLILQIPDAERWARYTSGEGVLSAAVEPSDTTSESVADDTGMAVDPAEFSSASSSQTITLIDRFLSSPPARIVATDATPEGDLSRQQEEADDMATEELAEIYLSQGLSSRAVACYRKLSLLYPEKSVYFAEIIDRIERQTVESH